MGSSKTVTTVGAIPPEPSRILHIRGGSEDSEATTPLQPKFAQTRSSKRKLHQTNITTSSTPIEPPKKPKIQPPSPPTPLTPTISKSLHRITTHPSLTPYRRLVYRTLLSVPPGRWTTYSALSAHLSSSARAIGNAMKTNPFAPDVPCHRVLATDRTIGGYKGAWGNGGSYAVEKTKLLKGEGIVFDKRGRADGEVFRGFVDMGEVVEGRG